MNSHLPRRALVPAAPAPALALAFPAEAAPPTPMVVHRDAGCDCCKA